MKSRLITVIVILTVLVLIFSAGAWFYVFRATDSNVAYSKADVEISAQDLLKRFESDENSANAAFLDKVILVTGIVEHVAHDSLGVTVYLVNPDEISGVICSFSDSETNLDKVKVGDPLKVKGICTGYLMDVVLNKCSIEE